ncbi:MAG: TetR family transcriptional regulator C-terminal domain-containing protein [Firmicutes bacterium]|nr:TetR family transcriptional regulator C-terminal domain-containing protein [Bacillota bacterium]
MKKENQRVALTKRLLRDALFHLLQTESLNKITITRLCQEADVNRATFYHHYAAPRDVLMEAATELAEDLKQISPPTILPSEAEQFMTKICTYLKEKADIVKVLFLCETDDDLASTLSDINQNIWEKDRSLIQKIPLDDDNMRLLSSFFISGAYQLIRLWLLEDIPKTPEEIAKLVCSVIKFDIFN